MRSFSLKLIGIIVVGLFAQVACQAQDWNGQSAAEQQRIREIRLLEWHAQQQAGQNVQQQQYIEQGQNQVQPQNISLNQPYQQAPAAATPEREDLFNAASAGNMQQINKLLSQGLDVNVSNSERETALHMAAARGHYEAVMLLVRKGAYVNAPTIKNWIPLHHAVRFRHPNIANFLIQRGSSAQARTSDGLTAIDMASNNRDYRLLSILGER